MSTNTKKLALFLLFLLVCSLSGCAILQLPGTIIGGTFKLIGKILDIVGRLPTPPPGVF